VLERVSGGVRKRPASSVRASSRERSVGARPSSRSPVRKVRRSQRPSGAGAGEEGAAGEALGVLGVGEVEVADVADGFDVVEREGRMRPLRSSRSIV
jgi:hypothetical protein